MTFVGAPARRRGAAMMLVAFCVGLLVSSAERSAAEPPSEQAPRPAASQAPESEGSPSPATAWEQTGWPLMQAYCLDCHNEDFAEAGLDLSLFEDLAELSDSEVQRVLEMVRFGAMPPEDYDTPETEERKQLVSTLEAATYASSCDLTPRAGKVTARRLNRNEYNNTVRDLFGLDLRPADKFPSDEVGAGFDNNGDVLSLSPMLIEKYLEAAEKVSQAVLIDPAQLEELDRVVPGDQIPIYGDPLVGSFGGRFLDPDSFAFLDIEAPYQGEYNIRVRGGTTAKDRDPVRVAICDRSGVLLAVDKLKHFGGGGSSDAMRVRVELDAGKHRLAFIPVLDDRELEVGKTRFEAVGKMKPERVDEILNAVGEPVPPTRKIDAEAYPFMFRAFNLDGPRTHPQEAFPPKQFELARHRPSGRPGRYSGVAEAAVKNLQPLMRRMFREPVTRASAEPYAGLVEQATEEGQSFYEGMQVAISALLVSPRFLFRVETPAEDVEPNEFGDYPLSQHQLATRLAYFLWSSTPDETLLDLADAGKLQGDQLQRQVERMLQDPRADAMATNFAAQWLGLRNLASHEADEQRFPAFDDQLKSAMVRETELFFLHVLRHNLSVREFLTADYTFVNGALAEHYGVEPAGGDVFQKVSLTKTPRRGLLAHASILTLTSTPNRTSPVLRGKWILENILGTKAPEPPPGVPELDESESADATATLREQLELHRQSATCASCHRVMDQLGFGLDDFDAVGQHRTEDAGKPIDASGALPDGRSFNGGVELSQLLAETEAEALARTVVHRLLTFALGRQLTPDDRCAIDDVIAETQPDQYRLADIVTAVVNSRQFQFQTAESALDSK